MLGGMAVGIATLAITLVVTFLIISQGRSQIVEIDGVNTSAGAENTWSYSYNSTQTLSSAVDDIPGWVPLIVIALIGSVLLGLVALFKSR